MKKSPPKKPPRKAAPPPKKKSGRKPKAAPPAPNPPPSDLMEATSRFVSDPRLRERYDFWRARTAVGIAPDLADLTAQARALLDFVASDPQMTQLPAEAFARIVSGHLHSYMSLEDKRQRLEEGNSGSLELMRQMMAGAMQPMVLALESIIKKFVPPELWEPALEEWQKVGRAAPRTIMNRIEEESDARVSFAR